MSSGHHWWVIDRFDELLKEASLDNFVKSVYQGARFPPGKDMKEARD